MWALSACSPGRSPTTWPCTSWRASRSPPPAPWGCWWTGTRASCAAGGYLIQLLPGAEEEPDRQDRGRRSPGGLCEPRPLPRAGRPGPAGSRCSPTFSWRSWRRTRWSTAASCSRERVSRALISMGREELESLIAEQGQAELSCQFCDKVYHFSKEELEGLLSSM